VKHFGQAVEVEVVASDTRMAVAVGAEVFLEQLDLQVKMVQITLEEAEVVVDSILQQMDRQLAVPVDQVSLSSDTHSLKLPHTHR
jgi:hypothetical protein